MRYAKVELVLEYSDVLPWDEVSVESYVKNKLRCVEVSIKYIKAHSLIEREVIPISCFELKPL